MKRSDWIIMAGTAILGALCIRGAVIASQPPAKQKPTPYIHRVK